MERAFYNSPPHTQTPFEPTTTSSNDAVQQEEDDEMQQPAMRAGPMTIASSSASAISSSGRDLVDQRQPTVPPVVVHSTQQSNASAIAVAVEADQSLHEPLEQYRSKELRKEVSRLKLKVNRNGGPEGNDHKNGYIALIRGFHRGPSKVIERSNCVGILSTDPVRDNQSPAHADPTIGLLGALFSDQFWRKFYSVHHTIAQRNKSMLSHTVTTPSIDMYSPLQSAESLRFWEEIASALRGSFNAGGDPFLSWTPVKLFNNWRHLCAAFNDKVVERIPDQSLAHQLAYLNQLLKRRPALASLVSVGNFYSTFAPIVPVQAAQVPTQGLVEVRQSQHPVRIPDDDEDDLAFITDGDDIDSDISQDTATQPSAVSSDTSGDPLQHRETNAAGVDLQVTALQREFWQSKKELVAQNIANAKLQFRVLQTKFAEEQLCGSKRKIQVLQEELRKVDQNSHAAKEINDELSFYVHEKRRMLDVLLRKGKP